MGSSSVQCTGKGWKSVNGDFIPKCLGEYVRVESALGFLLSSDENYSLFSVISCACYKLEGIRIMEDL